MEIILKGKPDPLVYAKGYMIRPNIDGKGFVILKKDLGDLVQKKSYNNNGSVIIEYWIYQYPIYKTNIILPNSTIQELEHKQTPILKSIICTKDNSDHIQVNNEYYYIKGIKIDNEPYLNDSNRPHMDLDNYLRTTKRK